MTLPSNASMDTHPGNTMANFVTELFTPIRLERDFEVALIEITLPGTEKQLLPIGSIELIKENGASVMIPISFKDIDGLGFDAVLTLINRLLVSNSKKLDFVSSPGLVFTTYDDKKYITIHTLSTDCALCFYGDVADFFGFPKSTDGNRIQLKARSISEEIDDRFPFLARNFQHTMFVYTNIIEYQYVGDGFKQLLSTIFVQKQDDPQRIVYDTPHYVPLIRNQIDSIQITIKDSSDGLIKFVSGVEKVILKLHFRPRNGRFQ